MKNLNDIQKQNNFKTPDGYFDTLNNEIKDKIEINEHIQKASPFQIFKPYMYMAASLLILAFAMKFGLFSLVDKKPIIRPDIETIANTEDSELLYELYADDIVFFEYLNDPEELYASNNIGDEEIEDYLCQYYLEYELLY